MDDYIAVNRKVYDATAEEFQEKKTLRHSGTAKLVNDFLDQVSRTSSKKVFSILELGPGSGYAAMLMSEKGHDVVAIEFSKPMATLAQQTAPKARIINDEFLKYDFKDEKFDIVFGIAFIHLFSATDAEVVMQKIFDLLVSGGIAMISTTKHSTPSEGFAPKTNFKSSQKRFRRQYDMASLKQLILRQDFKIVQYQEAFDDEVKGKQWMNFFIKKHR